MTTAELQTELQKIKNRAIRDARFQIASAKGELRDATSRSQYDRAESRIAHWEATLARLQAAPLEMFA